MLLFPVLAAMVAVVREGDMQTWQSLFLGARELPREISEFELQSFFTYGQAEHEVIAARRQPAHRLGLALHIGFLRMSGRPLDAFRIVPANLAQWARNYNMRTFGGGHCQSRGRRGACSRTRCP